MFPPSHIGGTRRDLYGWFALLYGLRFLQLLFFAFSWLHSQAARGVGVGFEEPRLRHMV